MEFYFNSNRREQTNKQRGQIYGGLPFFFLSKIRTKHPLLDPLKIKQT